MGLFELFFLHSSARSIPNCVLLLSYLIFHTQLPVSATHMDFPLPSSIRGTFANFPNMRIAHTIETHSRQIRQIHLRPTQIFCKYKFKPIHKLLCVGTKQLATVLFCHVTTLAFCGSAPRSNTHLHDAKHRTSASHINIHSFIYTIQLPTNFYGSLSPDSIRISTNVPSFAKFSSLPQTSKLCTKFCTTWRTSRPPRQQNCYQYNLIQIG